LLDEAAQRGCKTVKRLSMFLEKVANQLPTVTGVDATAKCSAKAVEEFLEL